MVQILPLNQVEKVRYWSDSSSTSSSDYTDSEDDSDTFLDLLQPQNTITVPNSLLDPPEQFKDEDAPQGYGMLEDNRSSGQSGIQGVEDSQQVDETDEINELIVNANFEIEVGYSNANVKDKSMDIAGSSKVPRDHLEGMEQYSLTAEMNLSDNFPSTSTDLIATDEKFGSLNTSNESYKVEENSEYGSNNQDENKTKFPQKHHCQLDQEEYIERRLETEAMEFIPTNEAQQNIKKHNLSSQVDQMAIDSQQICFQQTDLSEEYYEDSLEGDNVDRERITDFEEVDTIVYDEIAHENTNQNKALDVDFVDSTGEDMCFTTIREHTLGRECIHVLENRPSQRKNDRKHNEVTEILDHIGEKTEALYLGVSSMAPLCRRNLEEQVRFETTLDDLTVRQCDDVKTRNSATYLAKSGHLERILDNDNGDNATNTTVQEDGLQNGFDDQADQRGCGCDYCTEFKGCQDGQHYYDFKPQQVSNEDEWKYQQELYGCACYDCQVVRQSHVGSTVDVDCTLDRSRYGTIPCYPVLLEGSDSMYCDDIEGKQCSVEYCGIGEEENTCEICSSCSYCTYNTL